MIHRLSIVANAACAGALLLLTGTAHASTCTNGTACLTWKNLDTSGDSAAIVGQDDGGAMGIQGASNSGFGIYGFSSTNNAVHGLSSSGNGLYGITHSGDAFGVMGENLNTTGGGSAIYGNANYSNVIWAGIFDGDVAGANFFGNAFTVWSDRRLKHDIKDSKYGLNDVLKLRPVTFKWNSPHETRTQLGFVAQEVQAIAPEAIVTRAGEDKLGINYSALMPLAIKAIQQQQAIIDAQSARIARLEERRSNAIAAMLPENPVVSAGLLLAVAVGIGLRRRRTASA